MAKLVELQFIEVYKHNLNVNYRGFNFYTQYIGEVFLKNIEKKRIGIIGIKIELSDEYEEAFLPTPDYPVEGRLTIFNFQKFENSSGYSKKKMILDVILKIMTELSEQYHWDIEQFNYAYKKALEAPLPPNPYEYFLNYE